MQLLHVLVYLLFIYCFIFWTNSHCLVIMQVWKFCKDNIKVFYNPQRWQSCCCLRIGYICTYMYVCMYICIYPGVIICESYLLSYNIHVSSNNSLHLNYNLSVIFIICKFVLWLSTISEKWKWDVLSKIQDSWLSDMNHYISTVWFRPLQLLGMYIMDV